MEERCRPTSTVSSNTLLTSHGQDSNMYPPGEASTRRHSLPLRNPVTVRNRPFFNHPSPRTVISISSSTIHVEQAACHTCKRTSSIKKADGINDCRSNETAPSGSVGGRTRMVALQLLPANWCALVPHTITAERGQAGIGAVVLWKYILVE